MGDIKDFIKIGDKYIRASAVLCVVDTKDEVQNKHAEIFFCGSEMAIRCYDLTAAQIIKLIDEVKK